MDHREKIIGIISRIFAEIGKVLRDFLLSAGNCQPGDYGVVKRGRSLGIDLRELRPEAGKNVDVLGIFSCPIFSDNWS